MAVPSLPDLVADPLEAAHQALVVQMATLWRSRAPELAMLLAVPNGGLRDKRVAAQLQRQGTRAGVPDLCLPVPRGQYSGLWLELKRERSGSVAPEQAQWLLDLERVGHRAIVCWGWAAAWGEICEYLDATDLVPVGLEYPAPTRAAGGWLQRKISATSARRS